MWCRSLRSINLPSVEIVKVSAFYDCTALMDVKFGNKLERFDAHAFGECKSLERITIPLKYGIIASDGTFTGCEKLNHVDLVEGEGRLQKSIAALHLEDWRNDMNEEIDSINQILPTANDDHYDIEDVEGEGEKAVAMLCFIVQNFAKK